MLLRAAVRAISSLGCFQATSLRVERLSPEPAAWDCEAACLRDPIVGNDLGGTMSRYRYAPGDAKAQEDDRHEDPTPTHLAQLLRTARRGLP